MPPSSLLDHYDHVVLDLDGCVWVGERATPGAPEAVAALRAAGKSIVFLTNDARRSPEEYVRKLWSLGLQASLEEVVTVGAAIQYLLAGRGAGHLVYVIGSPAIFRHVADSGAADRQRHPARARRGARDRGRPRRSRVLRAPGRHPGGAGGRRDDRGRARPDVPRGGRARARPPARSWRRSSTPPSVSASVVGKPEPAIFQTALDRLGPGRTLVVGDRLDADLGGAARAGLDAAIVLSGVTSREEAEAATEPAPVAIAENLHALVLADMTLALIVNPAAGGGRAGRALPGVRGRADPARARARRRARPTSLEHARELARAAAAPRRDRSRARRRRADRRAWPARWHGTDGVLGVLPGGRGNDFARMLGIPLEPEAACQVLASGEPRAARPRPGRRCARSSGSPAAGSTRRRTGSPTRRGVMRGNLVYAYGALRALAGWRPATFEIRLDGGRARPGHRLHGRRGELEGVRRRHVPRPGRLARGRSARRRDHRTRAQATVPAPAADRVQGRARPPAERRGDPRRRGPDQRRPPVHDVRRRRSRSPSCPSPSARSAAPSG